MKSSMSRCWTLPVLGALFTIVPLFILIAVAFTNYDQQHMPRTPCSPGWA